MSLRIINVLGRDSLTTERVVLRADADCDTGEYVLIDNTYAADGDLSNKERHPYVFPPRRVREGEIVRVYTRRRRESDADTTPEVTNADGTTKTPLNHNFFWGLRQKVWNHDQDSALLLRVATRQSFPVGGAPRG